MSLPSTENAPSAEPVSVEETAIPAASEPSVPASVPSATGQTSPAGLTDHIAFRIIASLAVLACVGTLLVWQKLSSIQEHLARQSGDATAQATEARLSARQAQELANETSVKVSLLDARLAEVALQRTQLEELMQSLSRSRDENLVVDIESALRLAQQQAQLTGSVQPLLAALRSADQRLGRAAQPRLTPLARAIARDIDKVQVSAVADTPALLVQLDELEQLLDHVPLANAAPQTTVSAMPRGATEAPEAHWSLRIGQALRDELRNLLRVSRIEHPESALLTPDQAFFLRENLKLRVINARMGLLSRQTEAARADLVVVSQSLARYFDNSSRKTQATVQLLQQVTAQMRSLEIPRIDNTLAALTTAAAGR